jgi:hypothetical protein
MALTITVEGKAVGQRKPLFTDWQIPIAAEPGQGSITLRDLIERVVREEVAAFKERREERRVARVLSREQIEQGAVRGKIDSGGRESEPDVDPDAALETAVLAFQDGLYYVFVDEEQATDLEAQVFLKAESRVTFLRLVALAGG